jgi:hypothetical protein
MRRRALRKRAQWCAATEDGSVHADVTEDDAGYTAHTEGSADEGSTTVTLADCEQRRQADGSCSGDTTTAVVDYYSTCKGCTDDNVNRSFMRGASNNIACTSTRLGDADDRIGRVAGWLWGCP